MESELPEIGEIELADLVNELDEWDGTFSLPLGEKVVAGYALHWFETVQVKYEQAPLAIQAEVDAQAEEMTQALRAVGVDLSDPAQAHAFALGAYTHHAAIINHLAERCEQPDHPILHLAQGGKVVALVCRRATAT